MSMAWNKILDMISELPCRKRSTTNALDGTDDTTVRKQHRHLQFNLKYEKAFKSFNLFILLMLSFLYMSERNKGSPISLNGFF